MRELSNTLLAAQKAAPPINAEVKLVLTYGEDSYTYTKSQIVDIKETGNGPLQSLTVILNNADKDLTGIDLQGYEGVLSYGANKEYSDCPPMKVLAQEFDSTPGKLTCTLSLVGICNLMSEDKANAAYQPDEEDTKSVKTLVNEIAGATLACFSHCQAYEVVWKEGCDPLADSYKPKDSFRVYVNGNRLSAINRLLDNTKNVMLAKADGKLHIFLPTTSGESYDYTYSLQKPDHTFFAKSLRNRLVIPNRIVVQSQPNDDPFYQGEATDAESYAKLPKTEYHQRRLESDEQAGDIAKALLAKVQMWCEAGAANVPLNMGAEVYDYVRVVDSREKDERAGNIGRFTRHYNVTKNEWSMGFAFGDWQNVRKALAGLNITPDDMETYFPRLGVGDLYAEKLLSPNMGFYWIDPDNTVDITKILGPDGYFDLDNLPDGEQFVRTSTWNMSWDDDPESPTYEKWVLKMDEHTAYTPGYNPSEKRRTFTSTPTTPYDIGDLWLDADTVKRCITARASGAYVASDWIATTLDAIGNGAVFSRVKSVSLSAAGLVLLDQTVEGTYGLTKKASLSADGLVLLDQVVEGEYGLVKATYLSQGRLYLHSVIEDSSHRTVSDSEKGQWDDKAEVFRRSSPPSSGMQRGDIWIDTNDGYKPYIWNGYDWIAAYTEIDGGCLTTGIINCSLVNVKSATSGQRVELTSNGIEVIGGKLTLKDSYGSHAGQIYIDDYAVLRLDAWDITRAKSLSPVSNNTGEIGVSNCYWKYGYFNYLRYKSHGAFQSHDDIALIRQMKPSKDNPDLIDPDTIPTEILGEKKDPSEETFIDLGKATGLLFGSIGQLAAKVEALEAKVGA